MVTWARMDVNDRSITAMSLPGGDVWKYAYQRRRRIERRAKQLCPKRSGSLRASVTGFFFPAPIDHIQMQVLAGGHYAKYVHEGTGPQFGPRELHGHPGQGSKGRWRPGMQRAFQRKRWPGGTKTGVSGQHPTPFLSDALHEVMRDLH